MWLYSQSSPGLGCTSCSVVFSLSWLCELTGDLTSLAKEEKVCVLFVNRKYGFPPPQKKTRILSLKTIVTLFVWLPFSMNYTCAKIGCWRVMADYLVIVEDKPFALWSLHDFVCILIVINYAKSDSPWTLVGPLLAGLVRGSPCNWIPIIRFATFFF